MNFPWYISKRYLRAKKSHSAINIISYISIAGVAIGTMALVVVLSVFNGFDALIQTLFNSFDPDLKISIVEGKTFTIDSVKLKKINAINGIQAITFVVEENALLQCRGKQYIATIKGVSDNYSNVTGIANTITTGEYKLKSGNLPMAVVGQGVAYHLQLSLSLTDAIEIYVPSRTANNIFNPDEAFVRKHINTAGIFAIQQDFDSKYIIVPISFARNLLNYNSECTYIELKTCIGANENNIRKKIQTILGSEYKIQNRYQQQEIFYKIMKSEKWAIFFILSFIVIVASLNIIGSLTMLILDKKKDIKTLNNLGANWIVIRRIFLFEGWLVTAIGALIGVTLGLLICWLQIQFGFVKLQGSGSFVIDAYPVKLVFIDIALVMLTVSVIGFITSLIPVRVLSDKYFK